MLAGAQGAAQTVRTRILKGKAKVALGVCECNLATLFKTNSSFALHLGLVLVVAMLLWLGILLVLEVTWACLFLAYEGMVLQRLLHVDFRGSK